MLARGAVHRVPFVTLSRHYAPGVPLARREPPFAVAVVVYVDVTEVAGDLDFAARPRPTRELLAWSLAWLPATDRAWLPEPFHGVVRERVESRSSTARP